MIPASLRASGRAASSVGVTAALLAAAEADVARHPAAERPAVFERHARRWARAVLTLMGAGAIVTGAPARPPRGPRLIVSNHRTALDVLVLLDLFGGHFMSRADLAGWPLVGRGARLLDVVFVDREDRASGAQAIRTVRRLLREGRTVIVFPEGTTFPGDEVRPFQPGAFVAARGLDVEVVPVGLAYPVGTEWFGESFAAHASKLARRRRTPVAVCVGEARRSGGAGAAELAGEMRREVGELVARARQAAP